MSRSGAALEAFLRRRGLRLTRQRRAILEEVVASRSHFTADHLDERLRRAGERAAKATVYRTLGMLVEGGLVEAHDFGGGPTYYEPILDRAHHDHMVCIGCGRITEFRSPDIEALQDEQARRHRFTPVTHSLKLFGYCARCVRRRSRGSPPRRLPGPAGPALAREPSGPIRGRPR
ncbi:MAG TPA: transcriptional repressor [Planctomycetota bacterium]|jgi:Fur family ferric uptake transcriptional regulator|nr:transcriptional repressor [Planctomycetota bacterium]